MYLFRLLLAALHYNENSQREQAVTAAGRRQFAINYSKNKNGAPTVKKIYVPATNGTNYSLYNKCFNNSYNPEFEPFWEIMRT
jgi:hypothetical protein